MIAQGHRVNHILHLILSIITFGFWLIVWILMGVFGGEKRAMVTVDEYGNVQEQMTLTASTTRSASRRWLQPRGRTLNPKVEGSSPSRPTLGRSPAPLRGAMTTRRGYS